MCAEDIVDRLGIKAFSGLWVMAAFLIISCGKRQTVDRPRPESRYETAWIDPQIVISDSLFTLIRAERIDSFWVDRPEYVQPATVRSLMFRVDSQTCLTTVNLLNATGKVIRPLLVMSLSQGYYKLTLDLNRLTGERHLAGGCYLKADYCGMSVTSFATGGGY